MENVKLDTIHQSDCLKGLRCLPDNFIHCCVTSPPYWRLRDYNVSGQLGLEDTLEEYVANLVAVFEEIKRVLKPDGTVWLNLGDCYWGSGKAGKNPAYQKRHKEFGKLSKNNSRFGLPVTGKHPEIKAKDLIGLPWMVAFALRKQGWWLRQEIIWHKKNGMPESIRDRCTRSHEHIFMLAKSPRYYYNAAAIKTPLTESSLKDNRLLSPDAYNILKNYSLNAGSGNPDGGRKSIGALPIARRSGKQSGYGIRHAHFNERWSRSSRQELLEKGANRRSVWSLPSTPYKGAHFATFPPSLPETCIKAGSRPGDIILDPFMGSGTTAAAAKQLGRHYIGYELNGDYIQLACTRIKSVVWPDKIEKAYTK